MRNELNVPVLVLLGFAAWTMLTLFGSIGVYRWRSILTGRSSIAEWRADSVQGSERYQRAMRAHMNCVENLPIYCAIVLALMVVGLRSTTIDWLAGTMLVARIAQTIVHIGLTPGNAAASLRFGFFLVQVTCMIVVGIDIAVAMFHR